MAATVLIVTNGSTFRLTKTSLETVEFDGIRETMPVEQEVKQIHGPATIRIIEIGVVGDDLLCKKCLQVLVEGAHFCQDCGERQ